jgi:hypothetical protein
MTSSYFGYNACHSLGIAGPPVSRPRIVAVPGADRARTLTRTYKPSRDRNYNQLECFWQSFAWAEDYRQALRRMSAGQLLEAYATNAAIFFEPTSTFARSPITPRLPWRRAYDVASSGLPCLILCALCAAFWLVDGPWRLRIGRAALALPVLYVVAISILFERKEGMRYRYLVEPVAYVFVAASASEAVRRLSLARRRQTSEHPAAPPAVSV